MTIKKMPGPRPLHRWALLLIGPRTTAAVALQELLHATWPAARHSWIAVEAGFSDTEPSRGGIASESASESAPGSFCRGRTRPLEADRVLFPVEGGRLEFATRDVNGSTADWDWSVHVSFDEWIGLRLDGLETETPSFVARLDSDWRWNGGKRSNGSVCSADLPAVHEVSATADEKRRAFGVPRDRLLGVEATLAVETIRRFHRHDGSARASGEPNVVSVLRQCTYIRFVDGSDVKDTGPCGIGISTLTSSQMKPVPARENGTHAAGFAAWLTLTIVLGVTLLCLIINIFRKRTRDRRKTESGDGPVYNARAARLAQTKELVSGPNYATATATATASGGSPPSYEAATRL
ncbi:hypothetical protein E4U53_006386 [Claviceps sorghi]|nr:hypothetical protein E4U53_006386 [Claviceps sorghi]